MINKDSIKNYTNYKLWKRREDGVWEVIFGNNRKTRSGKNQYAYVIDGVHYDNIQHALRVTRLTRGQINYRCVIKKDDTCYRIKL